MRAEFYRFANCPLRPAHVLPISTGEVLGAIERSKLRRTPGPDKIENEMLKKLPRIAILRLTRLYNLILEHAFLPQMWRRILIVPIPKRGDESIAPADFRPVALSSALAKVFERVVVDRLLFSFSQEPALCGAHHGFSPHKSARAAIISLMSQISDGFNTSNTYSKNRANLKTLLVCLDLNGAFDSAQPLSAMRSLGKLGAHMQYVKLIFSWISDREAIVSFGGAKSKTLQAQQGLPQGSILSPILFACFLDNLLSELKKYAADQALCGERAPLRLSLNAVADDIVLAVSASSVSVLTERGQLPADWVAEWVYVNFMEMSPPKCDGAIFTCNVKELATLAKFPPRVLCCGAKIEMELKLKLLGFGLDPTLHGAFQAELIRLQLRPRIRALRCLAMARWGSGADALSSLYKCYVRP